MIKKIDHVQLAMPAGQEEIARRFFIDILSFQEIEKPEPMRSRGGAWFQAGTVQLHLGIQANFTPATKAHPAFLVEDLENLRTHLNQHQIPIKTDPGTPNAPRFFINDPFGNRIELIQEGCGFSPTEIQPTMKKESIIIRAEHFDKRPYYSRYDFLLDHYKEGMILDIGNIGGMHGKGVSNSSHLKFKTTLLPTSTVHGFDLFPPPNDSDFPNQKTGNVEDPLPYTDQTFDTIYLGEVLEHTMNPGSVLKEIYRILKDDGVFIMDVPNPYHLKRLLRFAIKRIEHLGDETHLIFFTPASLYALLTHVGFQITAFNTKNPSSFRHWPYSWVKGLGTHLLLCAKKAKQVD